MSTWVAGQEGRQLQTAVVDGHMDRIVERDRLQRLRTLVESRSLRGSDRLVAGIIGSALHLVVLDKKGAAACVSPYATWSPATEKVRVDERAVDGLVHKAPSLLAGLVCAEIANLMHRTWQAPQGAALARRALQLLSEERTPLDVPLDPLFCELLRSLAIAWWARLAWQTGRSPEAMRRLANLRLDLARVRNKHSPRVSGVDLVSAITLDLLADLHSLKGEHAQAMDAITEAWLLLSCGNSKDRVRTAHVLYTMGKVVATRVTPDEYYLPVLILERAERAYPSGHPLALRATNRKARCFLRGHQLPRARRALDVAQRALRHGRLSGDEEQYCRAEILLTDVLIREHEASLDRRRGARCIDGAKTLLAAANAVTPRLQLEAHLHLAIAEIRYGDRNAGMRSLDAAAELLDGHASPVTARIGILLARTEAMLGKDDDAARAQWLEATQLLSSVQSVFLREWRDRLAARLDVSLNVSFRPDMSYADAQEVAQRAYIRYQLERHGYNRSKVSVAIGVARPHLYEILKRLKINPRRGAGT